VAVQAPPELVARLEAHLAQLADPSAPRRPTTDAALAEAYRLREAAIALGGR
jgi:hypothetical protein